MECASHFDVTHVDELIDAELYGNDLLERIVAMLTKLIEPLIAHGVDHAHDVVPVPERGHDHGRDHVHGRSA